MKSLWLLGWLFLGSVSCLAQNFELVDRQDTYQTGISQTLRIPIKIKNTTEKALFYIIRKAQDDLNSTQKGYFCIDKNCLEDGAEEFTRKIEPGETLQGLVYTLETGLLTGQHNIRFEIFQKGQIHQAIEHPVTISIDERAATALVYHSKDITIHDIYPNPVIDLAAVEYSIHNESVKAKLVIHNILGKPLGDYELAASDTKVKIITEELPAGVYFYTLYINSEGVFTRKLIVRK